MGWVIDVVFALLAIRAVWKLLQGLMEGMTGPSSRPGRASGGVPPQGVQMARDPVCGTYVVPDRAVSAVISRQTVYFCSTECRDKYQAKTA